MNVKFNIDYHTSFGQELVLNIVTRSKSGKQQVAHHHMQAADSIHWTCDIALSRKSKSSIDYFYSVVKDGQQQRREWGVVAHKLELNNPRTQRICVYDHWIDIPEDSFLYSSAVTECVASNPRQAVKQHSYARTVRLKVRAPQLRSNSALYVVGAGELLGSWNVQDGIKMTQHHIHEWIADLDVTCLAQHDSSSPTTLEFKFVACQVEDEKATADSVVTHLWEQCDNRFAILPDMQDGDMVVYELPQASFAVPPLKCAGTLIPVFSLRSTTSFGVGDFGDLKKMIDWMALTHQRLLQVLPINDTTMSHTWTDCYPYSCISIFALHPQYVDLNQLPKLKNAKLRKEMAALQKELNALPQIDYERVNHAKERYLRALYQQEGATVLNSKAFQDFFSESGFWLVPYAQYCYLRDTFGTADFSQWKGHQSWKEKDRKALTDPNSEAYQSVAYYYYVQFILCTQMKGVHDYARAQGIILKGDIPIGVNRQGCDVWTEPRYFNLTGQTGAPPDDFSVNGQNWGFPTYNWQAMIADDGQWWVRRFQNMAHYFDAYRIDHVLGFFRIWEIPVHSVHGLLGQFQPSLAMSLEEIEGYGLQWQEELFTQPFITDHVLNRLFGDYADEVRTTFVLPTHDGYYQMQDAFDTQRKVEAWYEQQIAQGGDAEHLAFLRDGLYTLISDVLFLRDHYDAQRFHPRISAQNDFVYECLSEADKNHFNRLYNDYYYHRNNQYWYEEAMHKLPRLVNATRMLVCAEDLGMIPESVPWVMNELRILSLELQSMPKEYNVRFGHLSRFPYRSVCTISSHDMPTLRQWWDEDNERTQDYYATVLRREGDAPHPLPGCLARDIISQHLDCPSMLCVIALQDWLAIDEQLRLPDPNAERINIPANPKHYWRYRMHVNIEDLMRNDDFNARLVDLITSSGR